MSNASTTTVGELPSSPLQGSFISRSRSSTKLVDDVTSLTSFNPFSEEDENDQSSLTLVSSLFSRMKNTLAAPLSAATASVSSSSNAAGTGTGTGAGGASSATGGGTEARRPSMSATQTSQSNSSSAGRSTGAGAGVDRPSSLSVVPPARSAPPLVSLTPVISEVPTFNIEYDASPGGGGGGGGGVNSRPFTPIFDQGENGFFGTSIPGFPIQDDARSIRTTASVNRSASVSKVMRRIRGEGMCSI
jgi:1-phosphatidylinositol-3-phosphate 5-kinase